MKIVAVTACIAGLAHTYMAAEYLKKAAAKRGHEIKVETQGQMGIQDSVEKEDIDQADVVIFAVDTGVVDAERFAGKELVKVGVSDAIRNPDAVLDQAEEILNS